MEDGEFIAVPGFHKVFLQWTEHTRNKLGRSIQTNWYAYSLLLSQCVVCMNVQVYICVCVYVFTSIQGADWAGSIQTKWYLCTYCYTYKHVHVRIRTCMCVCACVSAHGVHMCICAHA